MTCNIFLKPWRALLAALTTVALAAGCGGGGGSTAGIGTGGTGAYAAGAITGFGSVIINGVRYDDSDASILDDDGGVRSRDDLQLGMIAEVVSGPVEDAIGGPRASASSVRYRSELKGPVSAVDAVAGTAVVFGQAVRVTATTVYEAGLTGGLSAVSVGQVLEVYATFDVATQGYVATRIEREDGSTSHYKLRGVVADLDTGARTFRIGTQAFSYAALAAGDVPSGLADGLYLRVRTQTTPVGGRWVVTRLEDGTRRPDDGDEAEIEGRISAYTSSTSFSVEGLPVDARNATFEDGTAGLALGARVEVEGVVTNGVLVARKVEIERDDDEEEDGERIELKGALSSLDTAGRTFVLRGVTVRYDDGVVYEDGSAANLANGRQVEVKGALASDGITVQASRIQFED